MNTNKAKFDAVVVGSGPNGLAAAVTIAREGHSVIVYEAKETIGGGTRSAELTLPGFTHDVCSAIHALGVSSSFFRELPLADHGLEWVQPEIPLAHPFDDGTAAVLHRSISETGDTLEEDGPRYKAFMEPLVKDWENILADFMGPLRLPRHPVSATRFGLRALRSAAGLAKGVFKGQKAQGLIAGLAGHAILPLETLGSAASVLILGAVGHGAGWPLARGGSQQIANALASYLQSLGGEIITATPITSLSQLPSARAVLMDTGPRQLIDIAGDRLPTGYRKRLHRYRYGPGVFKVDWALDGPIPWIAEACRKAGTVHLGGRLEEIAASEREVWGGKHPKRPYVLVTQQSLFDSSRAPEGKHTCWAYCHVPHGSTEDMRDIIADQIERFAPGFRDLILAERCRNTAEMEEYNPNYIGGDIIGGVQDLRQQFTRPLPRLIPYSTPVKGLYLCSSSTPPGGGVHGMCGHHAARAVLRGPLS